MDSDIGYPVPDPSDVEGSRVFVEKISFDTIEIALTNLRRFVDEDRWPEVREKVGAIFNEVEQLEFER